jgi:hypothetical protein
MDAIKRTSPPATTNGSRWEVQLSAVPSAEWLALFRVSGKTVGVASPQVVVFDRDSLNFKSDEHNVEHWIASIDAWIASTNTTHQGNLADLNRERTGRLDAEAKQRDRIQELNDRFKNL